MAEKRKLANEMEKVFRKVDEGCDEFNAILLRMHEASSDNQRDKLQDDLKKEIKKLQRQRDQIKTWQGSNDIKDKEQLNQYRRIIELKMESFKDIERENKTKPHSKQGLLTEDKVDPKAKAQADALDFLSSTVHRINEQMELYEFEIDQINNSAGKKKKLDKDKQDRANLLRTRSDRHKMHLRNLEIIMRLINNDSIAADKISSSFREQLDVYLDTDIQDEDDEIEDIEWIYEDLNIGDIHELAHKLGNVTNIGTLEEAEHDEEEEGLKKEESEEAEEAEKAAKVAGKSRTISGDMGGSGEHSESSHSIRTSAPPPTNPVPSTPSTPLRVSAQVSHDSTNQQSSPIAHTTPTLPYNSVAAGIKKSTLSGDKSISGSLEEKRTITATSSVDNRRSSVSQEPLHVHTPPSSATVQQQSPGSTGRAHFDIGSTSPYRSQTYVVNPTVSSRQSQQFPEYSDEYRKKLPSLVTMAKQAMEQEQAHAVVKSEPSSGSQPGSTNSPSIVSDTKDDYKRSDTIVNPQGGPTAAELQALLSSASAHQTGPQSAHIPPALGASPLGRMPLLDDQAAQLQALATAHHHLPMSIDSERLRHHIHYAPTAPGLIPDYYPQTVAPHADTYEYYMNLNTETLFFIFYYLEGTRAQYLAAKALKSKSWRFHKKYLMWFQRYEEPRMITDDYEQGAYIYFDFEKWAQRKKDGFTFEYKYLEDREL